LPRPTIDYHSRVRFHPVAIDGIAGPVGMDVHWFTGRHSVTVGGQPAAKTSRRSYQLPTTDGRTVEATVRSSFFDVYPALAIGGVKHRLGPPTPVVLRVLMLLPVVLVAGGAIGIFLGLVAILANAAVLRQQVSTSVKIALMLGILGAAALVWFILAVALNTAVT